MSIQPSITKTRSNTTKFHCDTPPRLSTLHKSNHSNITSNTNGSYYITAIALSSVDTVFLPHDMVLTNDQIVHITTSWFESRNHSQIYAVQTLDSKTFMTSISTISCLPTLPETIELKSNVSTVEAFTIPSYQSTATWHRLLSVQKPSWQRQLSCLTKTSITRTCQDSTDP